MLTAWVGARRGDVKCRGEIDRDHPRSSRRRSGASPGFPLIPALLTRCRGPRGLHGLVDEPRGGLGIGEVAPSATGLRCARLQLGDDASALSGWPRPTATEAPARARAIGLPCRCATRGDTRACLERACLGHSATPRTNRGGRRRHGAFTEMARGPGAIRGRAAEHAAGARTHERLRAELPQPADAIDHRTGDVSCARSRSRQVVRGMTSRPFGRCTTRGGFGCRKVCAVDELDRIAARPPPCNASEMRRSR